MTLTQVTVCPARRTHTLDASFVASPPCSPHAGSAAVRWRSISTANPSSTSGPVGPTGVAIGRWSADSAAMVFSATKGMAATVIHRLADRGLIDYEAPVAEYWPEFAANGKASLTVRDVMRHAAGLSGLRGASTEDLLDHAVMEERLAAAAPGRLLGKSAYHALTFGWLMSGLARGVTGKGMRSADPRRARRAAAHRRVVSGSPAGRRADAGRPNHRAAEPSCGTRSSAS